MLAIDQLQVRADPFDGPALFDGLSLNVDRGQAVGVIGRSGWGKSTLLRSIAGLIDPIGGTIMLEGQTPGELGWPNFRRRVSLVPQRPVVWEGSVASNLERALSFRAVNARLDAERARQMLTALGLSGVWDTSAVNLSEGERQRVCLVRTLLLQPDVLLLDEPTSALDSDSVDRVEALLLQSMREAGLGLLIATHDRAQAGRLCSQVIDLARYEPRGQGVADA